MNFEIDPVKYGVLWQKVENYEANTDYQAYLKWVAEGNTPLPAEGTE
jgi:hypothetical protein